jgi:hypothetical protein
MTGNDNVPDPIPPHARSRENGRIAPAFYARALGDAPEIDLEAEDGLVQELLEIAVRVGQ